MQKINLFINYFQCGDKERQKELDFCFNTNIETENFPKGITQEIIRLIHTKKNEPKF